MFDDVAFLKWSALSLSDWLYLEDFSYGVEEDEDDDDIDDELVFIKFADDMEEDEDVDAVDDEEAIDELAVVELASRETADVGGGGGVRIFDLLLFLM